MNTDNAKSLAESALNSLVQAVEQGRSQAVQEYLDTVSRFHNYSLGNQLLIAFQKRDATRVAGFNTWKSLGRYVKRGEKGIAILAPMKFKSRIEQTDDGGEEQIAAYIRFRSVTVFDVSQTEGDPLPEIGRTKGDPGAYLDRLKAFLAAHNITLEYTDDIRPALGTSSGGRIRIACGLSPAEEFSCLVHETAHELLHHGPNRPSSKTVRETEAEATAYAVSKHIGLDTGSAAHDYIALYDGDRGALIASLTTIRDTAAQIIAALQPSADQAEEG
ncbi:MAG TPA: ArdC-like ssDNA-binding domain-containing protein [Edaphobacter sp.]|nr:ArdC-like ssDNA-binding domain-containing protein [Edaphobacter sp.]